MCTLFVFPKRYHLLISILLLIVSWVRVRTRDQSMCYYVIARFAGCFFIAQFGVGVGPVVLVHMSIELEN